MKSIDEILSKSSKGKDLTLGEIETLRGYLETIEDVIEIIDGAGSPEAMAGAGPEAMSNGLAIVVGHTKKAPGATGVSPVGMSEYPWNKDLADKIKVSATGKGIPCKIFFRDGIGISGVYAQVKNWGAACAVELHFNAANGKAGGTETLYDEDKVAASKAWAKRLNDKMVGVLGLKNRGLLERDPGDRGYGSVSAIKIPTALIEPFFGDNPADAKIAQAKKSELAVAIAEAADDFFKTA